MEEVVFVCDSWRSRGIHFNGFGEKQKQMPNERNRQFILRPDLQKS